jgi:predicted  nucleic acid-binding Zn-ribbon protein
MDGNGIKYLLIASIVVVLITIPSSIVFYTDLVNTREYLDDTRMELDYTKRILESKEGELNDLRVELDGIRARLADTEDDLNTAKRELSITKGELDSSRRELVNAREELSNTRRELDHTKTRLYDTMDELDTSRRELNLTLTLLEDMKSRYEALSNAMKDMEYKLVSYTYREDNGDFLVKHESTKYKVVIDPIISSLNERLKLPYDIPIYVSTCGETWYAGYTEYYIESSRVNKIVICSEALDSFKEITDTLHSNGLIKDRDSSMRVMVKYLVYHEVGHAFIRIAELHTGSREESLVDDFAIYMIIKDNDNAIDTLLLIYGKLAELEGEGDIEVRHPSSLYITYSQMYYDYSCLAYGAGIHSKHISIGMRVSERGDDVCKVIWYEVSHGWDKALRLWWKN